MARFTGIAAAGLSVERMLDRCFVEDAPVASSRTRAVLVRTDDFRTTGPGASTTLRRPALSVFLYRVDFNKTMRAAWSAVGSIDGRGHLPLDLHFLLTPWASNAEDEARVLGRALECIEATPILTGPLLHPTGDWSPGDSLQLMMEEMSTEEVMRTFDSLPVDYRLSVPFVGRIVRLDTQRVHAAPTSTEVTVRTGT
jgi:hypothetical protein